MSDLASVVRADSAEAYELADKRGRLPERIEVKPTSTWTTLVVLRSKRLRFGSTSTVSI